VFTVYERGHGLPPSAPILLCFHGAGYTGLSFALAAAALADSGARVVAFDARGHGETVTDDDSDLSADTLAADAAGLWHALIAAVGPADGSPPPPTVALGHAMGGTIAVRAAAGGGLGGPAGLAGVILIDVQLWDGGAACAPHMMAVVAGRPPEFPSYAAALEFATRSGRCRNPAAVTVSFVSMLRERTDARGTAWVWRTPLEPSREHWDGWYAGLDAAFLGLPCPKLLLLSHRRPLTAALSVAQAQGKLQVLLLPQAGYAIHEDEPGVLADACLEFLTHFRVVPKPAAAASGGGGFPLPPPYGGGSGGGGGSGAATPGGAGSPRTRVASGDLVGLGGG
jgi:protein phosphatase methylesterase 1